MGKLFYDIIGCGAVVQQYHAPIILYFKRKYNLSVRGCFDLNIENAKKFGRMFSASLIGGPAHIKDIQNVDAAFIATPPDSHAELMKRYISKGKAVFVEKPFVTRTDDAETLVALAAINSTKIIVGNFRRFYPSVLIAKKIVESGVLGDIYKVEASEGMRWEWPAVSNYIVESPFGGVIYDTGAHLVDMALFVLSLDHEKFACRIDTIDKKPMREPSHECRARITIDNKLYKNLEIDLSLSRVEPLAGIIKIYGKRGTLLVPTAFSLVPALECEDKNSILKSISHENAARDEAGCFLLEHMELVDYLLERSNKHSILDGDNFISLIALLESLANSGA